MVPLGGADGWCRWASYALCASTCKPKKAMWSLLPSRYSPCLSQLQTLKAAHDKHTFVGGALGGAIGGMARGMFSQYGVTDAVFGGGGTSTLFTCGADGSVKVLFK